MAITINITDGTNTVDLSLGTDAWNEEYAPQNAGLSPDSVIETQTVMFIGGNSTVDANWQKLEKLFWQAWQWAQYRRGARVYIQVNLDGTNTWRSEIYDGKVLATVDMVKYERALGQRYATITVQRANWWEGAEAQVPLTNGNGTNNTAGLNVFNSNDGTGSSPNKKNSYIAITGTDVAGDLPAATRLEMTNNYSDRLYYLWIGQNWTDPANFQPVLEAENAVGATPTGSAYTSNGNYVNLTITTTEADALNWTLNAAFLNACKGNYYKAILKILNVPSKLFKFRIKIVWNSTILWQSGQIQPDNNLSLCVRDLVTFRLPPWLPSLSSLDGVSLILTAQSTLGTQNLWVDWLQLMPTDGWRYIVYVGYGLAVSKRLIDDGISGFLYQDDGAGATKIGNIVGYGNSIMLPPGKDQRLHFMMHSWQGNMAEIDRTLSVKLFYRPRRLTL